MPDLIQRILDGDATPEEIQRAERDPDLRAALASMRTIESTLKAAFPPATAPETLPDAEASPVAGRIGFKARYLGYAAVLALLAGVWWQVLQPETPVIQTAQLYSSITAHMSPEHVCSTPDEFETYTRDAFGTTITAAFTSPVDLIGWRGLFGTYESPDHPGRTLLARAENGEPVLAFFVHKAIDAPKIPAGSGLRVYTRRYGDVEVHELSKLDHPVVLPLLSRVRD
ncbi:MAG: hypothetical protein RLN60_02280 [Phycisphaerales bacterium]